MQGNYICRVVMPTKDECDQIAQQVISEAKAVFNFCDSMLGAPLSTEIAARISKRIQVSMTFIPTNVL